MPLVLTGVGLASAPQAVAATDWSRCTQGPADRQAVFERAARVSGVPAPVLLAVSFMESRWEDHNGEMSTSGGYGPMHLTREDLGGSAGRGDRAKGEAGAEPTGASGTLVQAAQLTGLDQQRLRSDAVANICGGAAVLAAYQPRTASSDPSDWSRAVALYATGGDEKTGLRFAKDVFATMRSGERRTTDDGETVVLRAKPQARVDTAAVREAGLLDPAPVTEETVDCPASLDCEAIPAPYEWYGKPDPYDYGNHDLADRPNDLSIDYIVIHNTEGVWERALDLVTDPTYLAWHYTLRSSDGHIAQHLDNKNVGWHAGNWYVNMHSIGLEHEGIAAQGATWFTESMYRTSARLVRHLSEEYDIPRDRAHIIGHDQIPGVTAAYVRGMHWDTGPFWDWEHYMELVRKPLDADRGRTNLVTVAPGFDDNQQKVTGCNTDGTCDPQGTNFVYLHTAPSEDSPLVSDIGLRPNGAPSTTQVSDIGARAAAGQVFSVADRKGDWLQVWWLGEKAWLHSPADDPTVVPTRGQTVVPAGDQPVPVYGRAYPEESAYPAEIPYQKVLPLQYTIKPGQSYALGDRSVSTDYYYAKTFDDSLAGDHTVVSGDQKYYQIWFGHRFAYVQADDVRVVPLGQSPRG
ncbi:N-acetylmuramoyl-L-alanine amidase [Nocardioides mesophilus]|uniref:N-acetylmuramoyl-L-alanine amidase n=1 Tax=Nocardioides mesophilus TaxID=433659 RepID=UPI001FE3B47C|nr:N-acetylmuramoyl-L-alanine amidase [Nocardioides mesophilus]